MTPEQLREAIAYGCETVAQAKRWLEITILEEEADRMRLEEIASWNNR